MTGHKEFRVITLDEETVTVTDKCVTRTLVLTRSHEVILVLTDFGLPSPFSCYCVRAQYFGPKHDLPSYKFKITLGGACKHNAEFVWRSGKKDVDCTCKYRLACIRDFVSIAFPFMKEIFL